MRSVPVLVALAALLASGLGAGISPASGGTLRSFTLEAVAIPCPAGMGPADGICLAYNGVVPGPLLDVDLLDRVEVTLVNHIGATIWSVPGDAATKARLANASVSFHVHGSALDVREDGMMMHADTAFADSFAAPGASFTYHFRAPYVGTWHYHDHVLGMDGADASEGITRGLAGSLVVRGGGDARPEATVDVHPVAGFATMEQAPFVRTMGALHAGGTLEFVFVALGDSPWTLAVSGANVDASLALGPGESEHVVVLDAQGSYHWTLTDDFGLYAYGGEVVAQ